MLSIYHILWYISNIVLEGYNMIYLRVLEKQQEPSTRNESECWTLLSGRRHDLTALLEVNLVVLRMREFLFPLTIVMLRN